MAICFQIAMAGVLAAAPLLAGSAAGLTVKPDARTGRLVRVRKQPARVAKPDLKADLERTAYRHLLPVGLLESVVRVESNYDAAAVSPKGALGLMQLLPSTARRFGVEDVFDPVANLDGGARYLRHLLDLYGDYPLALAAYNAGEGAVAKYGGVPPYPETQAYLERVNRAYKESAPAPAAAPPAAPSSPAGEYRRIEQQMGPDGRVAYVSR